MDPIKGEPTPKGLLPEVNVQGEPLQPGLALMLTAPRVQTDEINPHLQLLAESIPKALYPSFTKLDFSTGNIESLNDRIEPRRREAMQNQRLFFIVSPYFKPRHDLLLTYFDHGFYYAPTPNGIVVVALKINGQLREQITPVESREHLIVARKIPRATKVEVTVPHGMGAAETQESFERWLREESARRIQLGREIGKA